MSEGRVSNISRRKLLRTVVGASGTSLLVPAWLRVAAYADDPRVAQVISGMIGIDMHNHVYPAGTELSPQGAPAQPGEQKQIPGLSLAEELKHSGFTAVCASYVLDLATTNKPGDALENFLRWLTVMDAELAKGHMRRALNLNDLQNAHATRQPTVVQTVEGTQFIEGNLDRVGEVYRRGVRHLQLLHTKDDRVSPLGDVITSPAHLNGLTTFGASVVKECNRLGILVDMAHATPDTVLGALKVATHPILFSHTGLDTQTGTDPKMAEMIKPFLISKEHAKIVADAGGVVGVWTKMANSPKEFVENLKAMVDAIGIDHVGIGTDSDLLSSRVGQGTNRSWPDLTGGFLPAVVGEMLRQGFTPGEIGKVGGGNYCRIFDTATAGHA